MTGTGNRNAERRARRQFAQFMICGAAFVTLVAAKLFTPQHAFALRQTFAAALDRNMDVQGALSAVGRTFAGENDAGSGLRQVWEAAFIPASDRSESSEATETAQSSEGMEAAQSADASEGTGTASDGAEVSESTGAELIPESGETATESAESGATAAESPESAETLTQYHWSGSFGNSTAFASLSEPWPDASEASATADNVTQSASDANAETSGKIAPSDGNGAVATPSDHSAPSGETVAPSDGNAVEDKDSGQASVLYNAQNLPDNVGMEQVLLNFDYRRPVDGEMTSGFGYRKHPVDGAERFHYGVDFSAPEGTPVVSFADGIVTAIGDSVSFGKYCTVEHLSGFTTLYAHCSKITATAGSAVRMGDKLAEVGSTGQSAGPHLHFALQREGVYLNPIYYVTE